MKGYRIIIDYGYDGGVVSAKDNIIYLSKERAQEALERLTKERYTVIGDLDIEEYEIIE